MIANVVLITGKNTSNLELLVASNIYQRNTITANEILKGFLTQVVHRLSKKKLDENDKVFPYLKTEF